MIIIKEALYGANETWLDVTNILINKIKDNYLEVEVNNNLFGDPILYIAKQLKISYYIDNELNQETINEHDKLYINDTKFRLDEIYIINLENRIDRKNHVLNEMNKYNIKNYEFFKAIRPEFNDIQKWNKSFLETYPTNYRIGALGCLLSHLHIIKSALANNYKTILIMEDDVKFKNIFNKIYHYSNQINNNFDMLYLCGSHLGTKEKITNNIFKIVGTLTTGSYIITEKAMKYFVDNIEGHDKEADVFFSEKLQPLFNCYCIIPHLTTQISSYSDIQNTYTTYKLND